VEQPKEQVVDGVPAHWQSIETWARYVRLPQGIDLRCMTAGRDEAGVRLTFPMPGVLRVQMQPDRLQDNESEMLVPTATPTLVGLQIADDELVLATSLLVLHVRRQPWTLWIEDGAGRLVASQPLRGEAPALSWATGAEGATSLRAALSLSPGEGLFGLGAQTGPLNRCGRLLRTGDGTIPFFWSSRGYGLLLHSYGPAEYDLGASNPGVATVTVSDRQLDFFLFYGPTPADILRRYVALTGVAALPPRWAFGICLAAGSGTELEGMEEAAVTMRARQIPCDGLLLASHAEVARGAEWVRDLQQIGYRVGLNVSPTVHSGTPAFERGRRQGFWLRDASGELVCGPEEGEGEAALFDLTVPAARSWWQERLSAMLGGGASALWVETECRSEEHLARRYAMLALQTARAAMEQHCGSDGLVLGRAVWAGSQRWAAAVSSEAPCDAAHMMAQLRAGLGLGLSGIPFWAPNLGACQLEKDPILYGRWCQLSALAGLTCLAQIESGLLDTTRAAESLVREYATLRNRLAPYLYSVGAACAQSGLPLMRALVLAYPEDRTTWALDQEYLLGDDLLVAPAWEKEGEVDVYLPAGQWVDYWTHALHRGPGWLRYPATWERIPLFLRAGAIIPAQPPSYFVEERPLQRLIVEVCPQRDGQFTLYLPQGGSADLTMTVIGAGLELHAPLPGLEQEVVLHAVAAPVSVTVDGAPTSCDWQAGEARIDMGSGSTLVYQAQDALAS
jgi:alpha-D-xyloside xylohydrolase